MLAVNLAQLEANDGWQSAASKINYNFKNLWASVESNSAEGLRSASGELMDQMEDMYSKFRKEIAEAEQRLDEKVAAAQRALDQKIADVTEQLDQKTAPARFAPPVGTYMFSDTDPSSTWTGTRWEQVAAGNYLVSAGSGYPSGSSVGSNQVTLAESQLPVIHGEVWNMAQQSRNVTVTGSGIFSPRPVRDTAVGYGTSAEIGDPDADTTIDGFSVSFGGGQPHENRPQSICSPLWKRTA